MAHFGFGIVENSGAFLLVRNAIGQSESLGISLLFNEYLPIREEVTIGPNYNFAPFIMEIIPVGIAPATRN